MILRKAFRAGTFYPSKAGDILYFIEEFKKNYITIDNINEVKGAILPHAGWFFSGETALKGLLTIKEKFYKDTVDTFIIFGAVHIWGVSEGNLFPEGEWETPLGNIKIDDELADMILKISNGDIIKNTRCHKTEHSIEVQLPFIKYLFPKSKILPIMTPPINDMKKVGKKIGLLLSKLNKKVCILGSTDLTHYGPRFGLTSGGLGEKGLNWMKSNDNRIIQLMEDMNYKEILSEVKANHNCCGAGAIISTLSSLKQLGSTKGYLLEYTTSYDKDPIGKPSDIVGYSSVVFS